MYNVLALVIANDDWEHSYIAQQKSWSFHQYYNILWQDKEKDYFMQNTILWFYTVTSMHWVCVLCCVSPFIFSLSRFQDVGNQSRYQYESYQKYNTDAHDYRSNFSSSKWG